MKGTNIEFFILVLIIIALVFFGSRIKPIPNEDLVKLEQDLSSLSESDKSIVLGETLDDDIIREREKDKIYERLDKLKAEHAIENIRKIKEY